MLQIVDFSAGVGYVKAGLYGEAGTGKSTTAMIFMLGLHHFFNAGKAKIAAFDTETGMAYLNGTCVNGKPEYNAVGIGSNIVGVRSRALADLIQFIDYCNDPKNEIFGLIVDSTTHVWEGVQRDMLSQINKARMSKNQNPISKLEVQHREAVNTKWAEFTSRYLNSNLHIILCARSQNMWETEVDEETGKRKWIVTGTQMKVGADTAYEPSIVVQMERVQEKDKPLYRLCTVTKDRFGCMDGAQCVNPKFDFFLPYVKLLVPDAANTVNVDSHTPMTVNEEGDAQWAQERRKRAICAENLQGMLLSVWPSMGNDDKLARQEVVFSLLKTRSWTEVESTRSDALEAAISAFPGAVESVKKELAERAEKKAAEEAAEKAAKKKPEKAEKVVS